MQRKWLVYSVLMILLLVVSGCGGSPKEGGQIVVQEIPAPSLANNLLEEPTTQKIAVYLPKSYGNSEKRYPVIYFLPGFNDSFITYGTTFKGRMDKLIESKESKEMIVVAVNGRNKLHGSFYVNSPVTGNWEDFVTMDVVNYVDQNFRTLANVQARGIAGHSMGGFGSLHIAMRHPDVFSCVYSMSPGLFDSTGLSISPFDFARVDPLAALPSETGRNEYFQKIKTMVWPEDGTYAYGAAFSPDPQGNAPYIKFVNKSLRGAEQENDKVWQAWNGGFGNLDFKVKHYKENLLKLQGITVDYGIADQSPWIPHGCIYFSEQLSKENIPHQLLSYQGDHENQIRDRIEFYLIPFFSEKLAQE